MHLPCNRRQEFAINIERFIARRPSQCSATKLAMAEGQRRSGRARGHRLPPTRTDADRMIVSGQAQMKIDPQDWLAAVFARFA